MATDSIVERASSPGVGEEVRDLRTARRIGLAETSRRAGVAKSTLSDWEHGRKAPSGPALERVLDALEADPRQKARLLAGADPAHARWTLDLSPLGGPVDAGSILRAMRFRRGITQSEVAAKVGVTQSAVAKWESGDSHPSTETLHGVCFALGASPEEVAALSSASTTEPTDPLDFESLSHNIGRLSPRLQSVARLGLEADVWKLAMRNAAWDGPLCRVRSQRMYDDRLLCEYDTILKNARPVLRMARENGAWKEATPAFMALMTAWKSRGVAMKKCMEHMGRWLERLPESPERMWVQGAMAENQASAGDEEGAMETALLAREGLAKLGSHNDYHARQAFAAVRIAAGNATAALELIGDHDHITMVPLRIQATLLLGEVPPQEWVERVRAYARTEGLPYHWEALKEMEAGIARLKRS